MQLTLVLLGAILGLAYGHYEQGFIFSSDICLFAGIMMIMPTLFNVKFSDITLLYKYRVLMFKGLVLNYMILPILAIGIGLMTDDFGVAAGLFLLSVLSGGGLVMHWIKQSGANTSLGFVLLFANLVFVSLSLLMLHIFGIYSADFFGAEYDTEINISSFAQEVIYLLIIVPFLLSRVVNFIEPLKKLIQKNQGYISKFSLFVIVFYLFGLQNSQLLFEIYDFQDELFPIAIFAVLVWYGLVLLVSKFTYDLNSPHEKAAFWHSVTRYVTLALVISSFSIGTFGITMILPVMFAYIVQIPLAILLNKSKAMKG